MLNWLPRLPDGEPERRQSSTVEPHRLRSGARRSVDGSASTSRPVTHQHSVPIIHGHRDALVPWTTMAGAKVPVSARAERAPRTAAIRRPCPGACGRRGPPAGAVVALAIATCSWATRSGGSGGQRPWCRSCTRVRARTYRDGPRAWKGGTGSRHPEESWLPVCLEAHARRASNTRTGREIPSSRTSPSSTNLTPWGEAVSTTL